ncbi:hypothetical protein B7P43_G16357 [Cryptotermes secundus]|uniref:Alpha 1,4-glycosyltransferase domain-containing protein n=1 Tax=Cryptotermes secundus TaxID=105785 RepID=A0A2J7QWN4_9NEOP|nr:hypothetical protein B7P43_G16357 [Cryptotermes secundus]PNF32999.1 hypothetical protein B7P43_G16357 [Cryptotermes secundus]
MGKVSAVLAGSVLTLFMFFWYQAYIQTESESPSSGNGLGSEAEQELQINMPQAGSGEGAQNGHVGKGAGNSDSHYAEIWEKASGIRGETEAVPLDSVDITEGGVKPERTDNANRTRQGLNVTEGVSTRTVGNANSLESEPTPGDRNIIFIETGCVLGGYQGPDYLGLSLYKRQACTIESAAKMNPEYNVYILYSCPINGKLEDSSAHVRQIFKYPNVRLWRLDTTRYFSKTPLEKWDFGAAMASSSWPKEHSSDVLRLLTLWKYGGTYLDLDVVILKSLDPLGSNYVGLESPNTVANGVLCFDVEGVGRAVADKCLDQIRTDFRGNIWAYNGPELITRVLLGMCDTLHASELSTQRCKGFQILSNKEFFPIPYQSWELFFEESGSEETMEKIKGSFGVHVWNKLSKLTKVLVGSRQPYSLMAATACPRVYSVCGRDF